MTDRYTATHICGYASPEGAICPDCILPSEACSLMPLFYGEVWETAPACCRCGTPLDVYLEGEG